VVAGLAGKNHFILISYEFLTLKRETEQRAP
jgi:hypothetical protein